MSQGHSRIFAKKPIHEAWERLKGSHSCDRFFVDILLEQADLLVGFLSRYLDILSGSLRSGIPCEIDSDLFVFSYQDSFINMIRTRV